MAITVDERKLLVKNTTRDEREAIVKSNKGLAVGGVKLNPEDEALLKRYIEGEIELSEARELAAKRYKERS